VGLSGGCEIPAQPLCALLADMQLSADGPYRGNAVSCQVIREHDCGSLSERVCAGPWSGAKRSTRCDRKFDDHSECQTRAATASAACGPATTPAPSR
jgi:hypothetical protein